MHLQDRKYRVFDISNTDVSLCHFLLSALSRCPEGSGNNNSHAPHDQKFLLKWSVPLNFVEILEFGSSEDMADNSHYPAPHSGEKVVINAKPSMNHGLSRSQGESLWISSLSVFMMLSGVIGCLSWVLNADNIFKETSLSCRFPVMKSNVMMCRSECVCFSFDIFRHLNVKLSQPLQASSWVCVSFQMQSFGLPSAKWF